MKDVDLNMVPYMHKNVQMNHIQSSSFNRDLWGSHITTT